MSRPGLSMASKTSVNRHKGPVRTQRIQSKDPFPDDFLSFLYALPSDNRSDDETEHAEPPKKRARMDHTESIPIARESFTIKRPAQTKLSITEPISRPNFNRYVKLHYDSFQHNLGINSTARSSYGAFKSEIDLGYPKFTENALAILNVMSQSRGADEEEEGALWVRVTLDLERKQNKDQMQISLELNWNSSVYSLRSSSQRVLSQQVLNTFFGSQTHAQDATNEKLSPQAFYDAAFTPEKDDANLLSLSVPALTSRLFPFQRRALQWLLNREGVSWIDCCSNGAPGLEPLSSLPTSDLPLSFSVAKDADGQVVYISDLYHVVTRDPTPFRMSETDVRGGILAEEMGLGKTVEMISLICLHARESLSSLQKAQSPYPSGATLIVTPATLKNQWVSEFSKHAPCLSVMVYEGLKDFRGEEQQMVSKLAEHDVVITTYNVLQAEIHYAKEPPSRSMRHERKYRRLKSPLTQISWWRVCLDEAQQIESGVSSAAKLARSIPRVYAWGITGTPVKEDIKDLWGLLIFLHYEPFASSIAIWEGLITTHKELFDPLFNRISLRHTKRAVRDELTLPPQKRYVITMPFTAIEEQHYREQFNELVRNFGLDEHGAPLKHDWDPEDPYTIDLMKRALAQLRQSILHPSLGAGRLLRAADQKKALRTVEEVLDAMIEQSESQIMTDQRDFLLDKLLRGRIWETKFVYGAMRLWEEVVGEVKVLEKECRKQLQDELEKAETAGPAESNDAQRNEDSNEENAPGRVSECRRRLRAMLGIHHRAVFFMAGGYYQIKSDMEMMALHPGLSEILEEKEVAAYEAAKNIRKEISHETRTKALSCLARIQDKAATQSFVEIPEVQFPDFHGLESRHVLESFQQLGETLNEQAGLIDEWREVIIQLLLQPLVDEEDEAEITGKEYEDSTKIQDELMVFTLALRAVIADRRDAISGLENERIKYDARFAERQAKNGEGHAPEKLLDLLERRQQIKPPSHGTSFRGTITNLRELATKLRHNGQNTSSRAALELEIVEKQLKLTQEQSVAQTKAATTLERELDAFVTAANARVEYYRQLQKVSDTVTPLEVEKLGDLDEEMRNLFAREQTLQTRIATAQSKYRYLLHLKEAGPDSEEVCVICCSPFTLGVLTICGHQCCKECIMLWFETSRSCPFCKKRLTLSMLHDITMKKPELRFRQEYSQENFQERPNSSDTSLSNKSKQFGIYSHFSTEKLEAIRSIDLHGRSFATKIDTLAKHLQWLRVEDPGAKSVVFSQFGGFLEVLGQAFQQYNIGFTSFKSKNGIKKFKEDPAIECFLMDARAHASGLNLVNASHVFLCEPLLNTALELQAIARVDRIGQEHETTVWLYLIDGTVEESIYNLSVQRRLEHLGKNTKGKSKASTSEVSDLNLEAANSLELQQTALSNLMNKDQTLGEVVDKNDLWQCLFGHVKDAASSNDDRMNDPAVIGFLSGEAAEARRVGDGGGNQSST
ncbi:SNF2 family N-terminal domain-containing protein [Hypoxylon crocopeplum]|nr:SNF2 family N-terminal domain-containing protein [Hypoxylon crocopeplum]